MSSTSTIRGPRYTRGEKCIFWHIVVTTFLLAALLIAYFVHLLAVNHSASEVFLSFLRDAGVEPGMEIYRRTQKEKPPKYLPIGIVHLEPHTFMCNCMLIRYSWSLAPAQCVVARSDPDLANLLPLWRIKYKTSNEPFSQNFTGTTIMRSIAHPHYDSDDFSNNIGLFQHDHSIPIFIYVYPKTHTLNEESMNTFSHDLELIGWEDTWFESDGDVIHNSVRPISLEKCALYVSPIVDLREYEYCVALKAKRTVSIAQGAVLSLNSKFVGFFSWGESRGRGVPFIILDIINFKDWIQTVVSI